ncbi:MAG: hypothetical protein H0U79_02560 [Solirubrobacterales bacterium]|nr:hypothetical protein [Solirubrobacterales bacterium]
MFCGPEMRRAFLAALLGLAATGPTAAAETTEVGALEAGVQGSCPQTCLAVSRTTGYQAKVGPRRDVYVVPRDGRIVAWTLALGNPGPRQTGFLNERLGGEARAALVVLGPGARLRHRVVAKAPLRRLRRWFGRRVQFTLGETLRVRRGQLLALSVPTWAPALQVNRGADTSWRASRSPRACEDTEGQTALLGRRRVARFSCLYRTARLTYSATLVSTP